MIGGQGALLAGIILALISLAGFSLAAGGITCVVWGLWPGKATWKLRLRLVGLGLLLWAFIPLGALTLEYFFSRPTEHYAINIDLDNPHDMSWLPATASVFSSERGDHLAALSGIIELTLRHGDTMMVTYPCRQMTAIFKEDGSSRKLVKLKFDLRDLDSTDEALQRLNAEGERWPTSKPHRWFDRDWQKTVDWIKGNTDYSGNFRQGVCFQQDHYQVWLFLGRPGKNWWDEGMYVRYEFEYYSPEGGP